MRAASIGKRIRAILTSARGDHHADSSEVIPEPVKMNAYPDHVEIKPSVVCIGGQLAGKSFNITQQGLVFGRDSKVCDFAYSGNSDRISRIHCKLQFNKQTQTFVLYDMGSTYGTFLENGTRITRNQPFTMKTGESFYLGSKANQFKVSL